MTWRPVIDPLTGMVQIELETMRVILVDEYGNRMTAPPDWRPESMEDRSSMDGVITQVRRPRRGQCIRLGDHVIILGRAPSSVWAEVIGFDKDAVLVRMLATGREFHVAFDRVVRPA